MIFKHHPFGAIDMPPLHWTRILDRGSEIRNDFSAHQGRKTVAIVSCRHGHRCGLSVPPHSVSEKGVVTPSIQCPVIENGQVCDGHEDSGSVLEGWQV